MGVGGECLWFSLVFVFFVLFNFLLAKKLNIENVFIRYLSIKVMKYLVVCFMVSILFVNSYIPPISPVRLIVSAEAFGSSLIENFYREIPENIILTSMFKTRFHPELDILYLGLIGISMYSRLKNLEDPSGSRWLSIPMYSKIHKTTNMIVLILMLVFTKNIENAI